MAPKPKAGVAPKSVGAPKAGRAPKAKEQPKAGAGPKADEAPKAEGVPKPDEAPKAEEDAKKTKLHRYFLELRRSNKRYWKMKLAPLKIMSIGCLIGAYNQYIDVSEYPIVRNTILMEMSFFIFFFIIYTAAINKFFTWILWPVSDILNSVFAIFFLVEIAILILRKGKIVPIYNFVCVILVGLAILFTAWEIRIQFKNFRKKRMKANYLTPPKKPIPKANN